MINLLRIKLLNNQSGQGLLELVVALGVITVGLFSVWNFFLSNFNGEQEANARVLAVNLAREGTETVKNIRDSNWLHIENNQPCADNPCQWDSGLVSNDAGIVSGLLSDQVLIDYQSVDNLDDDKTALYINNNNGFYDSDITGQRTIYRRLIELKNICCADADQNSECDNSDFSVQPEVCDSADQLKAGINVKSTVRWAINGANREVTINNQLFNWK